MDKIIENIYRMIVELASLSLQRKLWLNENNDTGLISSYAELMSSLFDDFNFDDFIDGTSSEIGLSDDTIIELNKLRELLNNYNDKESDEEIINDPEWEKIVEQAKVVIEKWDKVQNAAKTGLKPLGLGFTGRTAAANLIEQLAMKEIMSNPTLGKTVMTGMKDSRWLGWNKMQYTHTALDGTKTTIHYVGQFKNGVLKAVDDFKFVSP